MSVSTKVQERAFNRSQSTKNGEIQWFANVRLELPEYLYCNFGTQNCHRRHRVLSDHMDGHDFL